MSLYAHSPVDGDRPSSAIPAASKQHLRPSSSRATKCSPLGSRHQEQPCTRRTPINEENTNSAKTNKQKRKKRLARPVFRRKRFTKGDTTWQLRRSSTSAHPQAERIKAVHECLPGQTVKQLAHTKIKSRACESTHERDREPVIEARFKIISVHWRHKHTGARHTRLKLDCCEKQ